MTVTLFSSSPDQYLLVSNAIGWQVYMSDLFADLTVRRRLNGLPKRDDEELDPHAPISTNLKKKITKKLQLSVTVVIWIWKL